MHDAGQLIFLVILDPLTGLAQKYLRNIFFTGHQQAATFKAP